MPKLSALSRRHLIGVKIDLVRLVEGAILITPVDFRVNEGLRTAARQAALVKAGASQTQNSRHLTGHAVDLLALVERAPRWDWPLYYHLAAAMAQAAREADIPCEWGGTWADIRPIRTALDAEQAVAAYTAARHRQGRRAFIDGPHFQLPRSTHP